MYKRILTAIAAAILAAILLTALGPIGAGAITDAAGHTIAQAE